MKIEHVAICSDGGTKIYYLKIVKDGRIGSETNGELFDDLPSKGGRLLRETEREGVEDALYDLIHNYEQSKSKETKKD